MIQVTITLDDKGQLNVGASTNNILELYGLLGMAHNALGENARKAAEQRVQLAPAMPGLKS
jgi:hypothetical protein